MVSNGIQEWPDGVAQCNYMYFTFMYLRSKFLRVLTCISRAYTCTYMHLRVFYVYLVVTCSSYVYLACVLRAFTCIYVYLRVIYVYLRVFTWILRRVECIHVYCTCVYVHLLVETCIHVYSRPFPHPNWLVWTGCSLIDR